MVHAGLLMGACLAGCDDEVDQAAPPSTEADCSPGALEERTRFREEVDVFACESETQTRLCEDGTWSAWTGSYQFEDCREEPAGEIPPDGCSDREGDADQGATQTRTRYENAAGYVYGGCRGETQERTCEKGGWTEWSGSFTEGSCQGESQAAWPEVMTMLEQRLREQFAARLAGEDWSDATVAAFNRARGQAYARLMAYGDRSAIDAATRAAQQRLGDDLAAVRTQLSEARAAIVARAENSFMAYTRQCESAQEAFDDQLSAARTVLEGAELPDEDQRSAALARLDAYAARVAERYEGVCTLSYATLYRKADERLDEIEATLDEGAPGEFNAWLTSAVEATLTAMGERHDALTLAADEALEGTSALQDVALSGAELRALFTAQAEAGIHQQLNGFYWQFMCQNGDGEPTLDEPCGPRGVPASAEYRENALERVRAALTRGASDVDLAVAAAQLADLPESELATFSEELVHEVYEADEGVWLALDQLHEGRATPASAYRDTVIFDALGFVWTGGALPAAALRDNILFDSLGYVWSGGESPAPAQRDDTLFDALSYLKGENAVPAASRRDDVLFDSLHYVWAGDPTPRPSARDSSYVDCVAAQAAEGAPLAPCNLLLDRALVSAQSVHTSFDATLRAVDAKLADHPSLERVAATFGTARARMLDALSGAREQLTGDVAGPVRSLVQSLDDARAPLTESSGLWPSQWKWGGAILTFRTLNPNP